MPIKQWQLTRIRRELADIDDSFFFDGEETIEFQYGKYAVIMSGLTSYPFSPPHVNINGQILSYTPRNFPKRLYKEHTLTYPHKCPCCVSIYCTENWSPALGIKHIMKEYIEFIEKLKTYQKIRMFQGIRMPDDIIKEIISFLL
jgi:ubiquitin-protein ligase